MIARWMIVLRVSSSRASSNLLPVAHGFLLLIACLRNRHDVERVGQVGVSG
jgi:hypothetical protein